MKLLISILAIALIVSALTFTPGTAAQSQSRPRRQPQPTPSPQQVGEGDVIRIDTELVTLTATVTDARGRYRADLKQSDFTVYEDGVKQEVAYFSTGDRVPMSLGILFDTSEIGRAHV